MVQTVYIDIFFLINFSMDFLGLFLGIKLLGYKKSLIRLILAALFGGVYASVSLILSLDSISPLLSFAVDAVACIVMAFIAIFHKRALKSVFSFALVFGAISILLGGAMTALFYLFNRLGLDKAFSGGDTQINDGMSVWLFAIFAAISGGGAILGGRFLKRKTMHRSGYIEIEYRGKSVKAPCICDSGNLLREPISQNPCILVELDAIKGLFSRSFCECIRRGTLEKIPLSEACRIRMIPASGAFGEDLLVGMRLDSVRVDMGKGSTGVEAYIVLVTEKISAQGAKALVPSEIAFCAV